MYPFVNLFEKYHTYGYKVIIILYKMVKYLLLHIYTYFNRQTALKQILQRIIHFGISRRKVLVPAPFQIIIRCVRKGDSTMNHTLQDSIDYLISAWMIVTLLIWIIFGTLFLTVQVSFSHQMN